MADAILPPVPRPGNKIPANTTKGQCHRYQEYDRAPTNCSGAAPSAALIPRCGALAPANSVASVPATGSNAIQPGKPAPPLSSTADAKMVAMPRIPQATALPLAAEALEGGSSASSPPAANSQARAGSS